MYLQGTDGIVRKNIMFEIHREKYAIRQHIHHNPELVLVLDGKLSVTVNEKTEIARGGQFILIFPFKKHSLFSDGECVFLMCTFPMSILSSFAAQAVGKSGNKAVFDASELTVRLFDQKLIREENASVYGFRSCMFAMIDDFTSQVELREDGIDSQAVDKLIHYVNSNYKDNLSLQEVAKAIGYSSNYLSHCISKTLGMNYRSFLGSTRAEYAKFMLQDTNQSILEIALECGYPNVRSFQRHFKNYTGFSPMEYKNRKIELYNGNSADGSSNWVRKYIYV